MNENRMQSDGKAGGGAPAGKMIFVAAESLAAALERLTEKVCVWVPAAAGNGRASVEFKPYGPEVTPVLDRQSTLSPKSAVFPQSEPLLRFEYKKDAEDPSKVRMSLEETIEARPVLIFGGRPCDARGFLAFDEVFSKGPFQDNHYAARRENAFFATLVCREGDEACFCSSVGSGPADMDGSDVRVTPIDGGYAVEALNERGAPLVELMGGPATDAQIGAARKVQEEVAARRVGDLDVTGAPEAFLEKFKELDHWGRTAGQCLSCGVCTFVCPTCYCFTITDEKKGMKGERLRSWDSCMFCQYTQEASGHNPRPTKLERFRNRVGHKFSYIPGKYAGKIGCCGCGRCIRACPVSIDIREAVDRLKEKNDACA